MFIRRLAVAAIALVMSQASLAQNYQPRLEQLLRRALSSVAAGRCAPELMTPVLQYQCEQQVAPMAQHLQRLGSISSVTFRGTQAGPTGVSEAYLVQFGNGQMMWVVASDPDGKLVVFWSPG